MRFVKARERLVKARKRVVKALPCPIYERTSESRPRPTLVRDQDKADTIDIIGGGDLRMYIWIPIYIYMCMFSGLFGSYFYLCLWHVVMLPAALCSVYIVYIQVFCGRE